MRCKLVIITIMLYLILILQSGVAMGELYCNGLEEIATLNFHTSSSGILAYMVGGLEWTKNSGVGTISNTGDDGTADYDSGATAGPVNFRLTIKSGPSANNYIYYSKSIIAPTGTNMTRVNPNNVWLSTKSCPYNTI